jgi:CHAD domain-containing protein
MRVATRRIRAALRAFKSVLPATPVQQFNGELKWVAALLGDVRDLDVYQDNFRHYTAEIPEEDGACLSNYRKHLAQRWQEARQDLLACLSSQRYQRLKDEFARFLQHDPSETGVQTGDTPSIREAATRFIGKQYRRVLRDGRAITPDSPDESFHALRIDCKRLRYLFEFFHPPYGKSLNPFIKKLKKLQDLLGEFQDACVATQRLRQYAEGIVLRAESRAELIALGQLIHSQRRQAADRRARFHDVWGRFDRRGRRKQILAVLK